MARRGRTRFIRPAARTKMWIGGGVGTSSVVADSENLISSLSAGALLLRPFTILRTRLELAISTDQQSATETPFGDFGMIVITDTAVAVGITAIPMPGSTIGDPDADWFVHQPMSTRLIFSSAVGMLLSFVHYTVDSKAMRKVGPDDNVVQVWSQEASVGGVIMTHGRLLIQLH